MKKLLVLLVLFAAPAFAQYPEELMGVQLDSAGIPVQIELDVERSPWGDLRGADPEILYFGYLSGGGDFLELDLFWEGHHCGEMYWNVPCQLRRVEYAWDEDIGSYIHVISKSGLTRVVYALTFQEDDPEVLWRNLVLKRSTVYPYGWSIDPNNYREGKLSRHRIYMTSHAVIRPDVTCNETEGEMK